VKGIKKKGQPIREITHYFSKVQKQPATVNRNIPTPDKAAIEQIDQAFAALLKQEQELTQQI
jgi:ferritin